MEKLPKKSEARVLTEAVTEGVVALIPVVGGAFSIAFLQTMNHTYNKRRDN